MAFGIAKRKEIIEEITSLKPFVIGSMRGAWYPCGAGATNDGRIKVPAEWMEELHAIPVPTYVVYSYGAPIAWHRASGVNVWTVPGIRYSVTTSHHQSLTRQAIKLRGERIDEAIASLINQT